MNNVINSNQTAHSWQTTNFVAAAAVMMVTFTLPSTVNGWEKKGTPTYETSQVASSYSGFTDSSSIDNSSYSDEFVTSIMDFYASLLESQEPLGEEFERILNDNIVDLYES